MPILSLGALLILRGSEVSDSQEDTTALTHASPSSIPRLRHKVALAIDLVVMLGFWMHWDGIIGTNIDVGLDPFSVVKV